MILCKTHCKTNFDLDFQIQHLFKHGYKIYCIIPILERGEYYYVIYHYNPNE